MTIRRYTRTSLINGGTQYGTSRAITTIKQAVDSGQIAVRLYTLQGKERLDTIAGRIYGESSYWWIIAAASGIGWALQVPPGTRLLIPTDLNSVADIVG
jgi:hypothetical protein